MTRRCTRVLILLAIALLTSVQPHAVSAQDPQPIRVLSIDEENDFPNGLTFRIEIEADHPLAEIDFYYRTQGDPVVTKQPVEFEPDTQVVATYTWVTSRMTVAPSSPVLYYWKIRDTEGNHLATPEQLVYYDDQRFPWQELCDDELIVRWYKGDEEFGRSVYETAQQSLSRMKEQSGRGLEYPVFVLLYANEQDFEDWHYYSADWIAGQAFPPLGITAQIVPSSSGQNWVQSVIPHEIAHLFFYQAIQGPWAFWPVWLDEGLAQYYELSDNQAALARAASASRRGTLIPLDHLYTGFSRDAAQARLGYDESLSVVTYVLETWGDEGLQGLIVAFHEGELPEVAVQQALGVTWEDFQSGWIEWMESSNTEARPTGLLVLLCLGGTGIGVLFLVVCGVLIWWIVRKRASNEARHDSGK